MYKTWTRLESGTYQRYSINIGDLSIWVKNSRVGQKKPKQTNKQEPHENHKENGFLHSIYVHNLNPTSPKTKKENEKRNNYCNPEPLFFLHVLYTECVGFSGEGCIIHCPPMYYGSRCSQMCNCTTYQQCNQFVGCLPIFVEGKTLLKSCCCQKAYYIHVYTYYNGFKFYSEVLFSTFTVKLDISSLFSHDWSYMYFD